MPTPWTSGHPASSSSSSSSSAPHYQSTSTSSSTAPNRNITTTTRSRSFRTTSSSRSNSTSTLASLLNRSEYRSQHLPLPSARFKAVLGYKRTYSSENASSNTIPEESTSEMPHNNNENQPLLPGRRQSSSAGGGKKFDPIGSTRHLVLGSWLSLFLVFLPLAFVAEHAGWSAALRFSFSFLAIVPLAKLLGDSTEQLSMKLGQTLGGLLNATFGNAVELIVAIAALVQNELRLVQMSLLGSVLSNLLLVLGMSFAASGFYFYEATFQMTAAQASSSLMTLACITLILPAAYHFSETDGTSKTSALLTSLLKPTDPSLPVPPHDPSLRGLLILSRGTSIILLLTYILYLIFQLRTHSGLFEAEVVDGEEEEEADMDQWSAGAWLVLVTVATAFTADILVGSIDETATQLSIPKRFIGLILLPLVGNAAEHVTSVWMACKGKMELTIGVSVGSSIQIAAGMIPLLVIIAWGMDKELTLFFANFETVTLFVSVMLVNLLLQDGRANYMEGVMLIALYLVIALSYSVSE